MSTMQIWSHWSTPISSSWFKPSGMCLYMVVTYISTLGPLKKFQPLTRAEEVVIYPTSNWPYQGHQGPWTPDCVSPLWWDTDYWPYAPGVCSVTGKSWQIIHSWLIEYSLCDNSWDLHCGILARSGILLPDMNGQTFYAIPHLNNP